MTETEFYDKLIQRIDTIMLAIPKQEAAKEVVDLNGKTTDVENYEATIKEKELQARELSAEASKAEAQLRLAVARQNANTYRGI